MEQGSEICAKTDYHRDQDDQHDQDGKKLGHGQEVVGENRELVGPCAWTMSEGETHTQQFRLHGTVISRVRRASRTNPHPVPFPAVFAGNPKFVLTFRWCTSPYAGPDKNYNAGTAVAYVYVVHKQGRVMK